MSSDAAISLHVSATDLAADSPRTPPEVATKLLSVRPGNEEKRESGLGAVQWGSVGQRPGGRYSAEVSQSFPDVLIAQRVGRPFVGVARSVRVSRSAPRAGSMSGAVADDTLAFPGC